MSGTIGPWGQLFDEDGNPVAGPVVNPQGGYTLDPSYNNDQIGGITSANVTITSGTTISTTEVIQGNKFVNWTLGSGIDLVDDGSFSLAQGNAVNGTIDIDATGAVTITAGFSTNELGFINFGSPGGTVLVNAGVNNTITDLVTGVEAGDTFAFSGVAATSISDSFSTSGTTGIVTATVDLYSGTGQQLEQFQVYLGSNPNSVNGFGLTESPNGIAEVTALCFLEGTAIATPDGETAVEALQVGDLVTTIVDGKATAKPVTWLGHRSVKPGDLSAQDAHPVRIKADAFAAGMPKRDLLVTAEHCILVDGGLIPARLLVNGSSIIFDTGISSFTYYHVELEQHSILLAEGLTTESYLDTGNRGRFANADVTEMRPRFTVAEAHEAWANAAAPLTVDVDHVKPVWDMLSQRAQDLGIAVTATAELALSSDPDLHLVLDNGIAIRPLRQMNDKYLFMLPPEATSFRLVSHTARPSDITPYLDDRRNLGVLVGEISFYEGRKKIALDAHLRTSALQGWFQQENDVCRWTNGNAELPMGVTRQAGKTAMLEVQIVNAGPYRNTAPAIAA